MIRRWIIRAFAILVCYISVVVCVMGMAFPMRAQVRFGVDRFYGVDWISTDVVAFTCYRPGSGEFEYFTEGPMMSGYEASVLKGFWDSGPHFAGFGGWYFDKWVGPTYFIRVPLWFVSLLSVVILVLAFRRTRRISAANSFPVEGAAAANGMNSVSGDRATRCE